jgi:hypothetical protein
MPSQLDLSSLKDHVDELNETHPTWSVTQAPDLLRVYVHLKPFGSEDSYCVRLEFGENLAGPPSVTFCHPQTFAEGNPRDWPANLTQYYKHPPGNGVGWICSEWTREGWERHAEWNRPWKATRVVWRVATAMQDILDKPGNYTGRNQ